MIFAKVGISVLPTCRYNPDQFNPVRTVEVRYEEMRQFSLSPVCCAGNPHPRKNETALQNCDQIHE
jgi:hypothetical protein